MASGSVTVWNPTIYAPWLSTSPVNAVSVICAAAHGHQTSIHWETKGIFTLLTTICSVSPTTADLDARWRIGLEITRHCIYTHLRFITVIVTGASAVVRLVINIIAKWLIASYVAWWVTNCETTTNVFMVGSR